MDSDFHKMLLEDLDEIINNPDEFGGVCKWQGKEIRYSNLVNYLESTGMQRPEHIRQILCNPRDFSRIPLPRDLMVIDGVNWYIQTVDPNVCQYVISLMRTA